MKKKFIIFFIASIIVLLPGQSKGQEKEIGLLEILSKKIDSLKNKNELLLKDFTETAHFIEEIGKLSKETKQFIDQAKTKRKEPILTAMTEKIYEDSLDYINRYKPILYNLFKIKQAVDANNKPIEGLISLTYYDPRFFQFVQIYLDDPLQNIDPSIKQMEFSNKLSSMLGRLKEINNLNKASKKAGQLTLDRFNATTSLIKKINDLKIELIKNDMLSKELQSTLNNQINKQKEILYNLFEAEEAAPEGHYESVEKPGKPIEEFIYITYDVDPSPYTSLMRLLHGKHQKTIVIKDPLWLVGPSIYLIQKLRIFKEAFDSVLKKDEELGPDFEEEKKNYGNSLNHLQRK